MTSMTPKTTIDSLKSPMFSSSATATPTSARRRIKTPATATAKAAALSFITNTPSKRINATPAAGDRFVPSRATNNIDFSAHKLRLSLKKKKKAASRDAAIATPSAPQTPNANTPGEESAASATYHKLLAIEGCRTNRILNFSQTPSRKNHPNDQYWSSYSTSLTSSAKRSAHSRRKVPRAADKVLDAPNLINDYYLNVLDWSPTNLLAIGLGGSIYVLDVGTGEVGEFSVSDSASVYVSSLQWSRSGQHLAVGTSDCEVQLWDMNVGKISVSVQSHDSRVSCLSWHPSGNVLSSGSQSGQVHNLDLRGSSSSSSMRFEVQALPRSHGMEVCGLSWSPTGRFLASGGNDNVVNIWDTYSRDPWSAPAHTLTDHLAAVKALSWCPWQPSLLATGGGTADKSIRLWNACSGKCEASVITTSQISGLRWSKQYRELVSCHGSPKNHLAIWSYPSLSRVGEMSGHEGRVLHMTTSPDGQTVATAGADETLRLWNCFPLDKKQQRLQQQRGELSLVAGNSSSTSSLTEKGLLRFIR